MSYRYEKNSMMKNILKLDFKRNKNKFFFQRLNLSEGRGIGLMIIICGVSMFVTSYIIYINRNIRVLENNYLTQKKYTDGAKRL